MRKWLRILAIILATGMHPTPHHGPVIILKPTCSVTHPDRCAF